MSFNPDMVSRGTGNTFALFGDFSKFRVRNVKGLYLTRFNELSLQAVRCRLHETTRIDSMLVDTRAIGGLKGL